IETDLLHQGYERDAKREPSFLVASYMGARRQYDTRLIGYGFPGGWRRWGWGVGGVDVWNIPYSKSTLVLDVIDARPTSSCGAVTIRKPSTSTSPERRSRRALRSWSNASSKRLIRRSPSERFEPRRNKQ